MLTAGLQGINSEEHQINWIGKNIQNLETTGYSAKNGFSFELSRAGATPSEPQISGVSPQGIDVNWEKGGLNKTDKPTNLGIDGEGMFPVEYGGETAFTRAGDFDFSINESGSGFVLSRPTGEKLVDASGQSITFDSVPDQFEVTPDGQFANLQENQVSAPGVPLQLFANPGTLQPLGNGLYRSTEETVSQRGKRVGNSPADAVTPGTEGSGKLRQGNLEASNVDLAEELSRLMQAQRAYQANSRSIQTGDSMLKKVIQTLS